MRTARLHLVVVTVFALAFAFLPVPTSAAGAGISVLTNRVEHSFAQQVTFTLEAASDAEISEVYLFFRATHDDETEKARVSVEEPSRNIDVVYTHDVRHYPLPPFADIAFWWQIEDTAGNQLKTAPKYFEYTDNRFEWNQIEASGITIHWMADRGDPAFAQAALDISRASVEDIQAELHGPTPEPLDIFIYDSEANLEAAMMLTGRDWVGGQARPELGVVVVAVPPEQGYSSRMKRYLPHEITHLLIYETTTPEGYQNIPDWLDEGLATVNERLPTPEYALALEEAREAGRLVSLEKLCVPFSPDPRTAILSYAESASVVTFIREKYGADGIRRLVSAYADGASCSSGVEEALGDSLSKLETEWRVSLEPEAGWRALVNQVGVWMGLWLLTLLLALPMVGGMRRRSNE